MNDKIIVDFDDLIYVRGKVKGLPNGFKILEKIKNKYPGFKVNLFAIPALCPPAWIKDIKKEYDWISIGMHGWQHAYNDECKDWTGGQTRLYLSKAESIGFDKVFKAPGWQVSGVVRNAILDMGWILVDRYFNYPTKNSPENIKEAISPNFKILLADERNKWYIHGHVQDIDNKDARYQNGIKQLYKQGKLEFSPDKEFLFIKDLFNERNTKIK